MRSLMCQKRNLLLFQIFTTHREKPNTNETQKSSYGQGSYPLPRAQNYNFSERKTVVSEDHCLVSFCCTSLLLLSDQNFIHLNQCDQIRQFLKVLGNKKSSKKKPKWLAIFWLLRKTALFCKKCSVTTFGATFWKKWITINPTSGHTAPDASK